MKFIVKKTAAIPAPTPNQRPKFGEKLAGEALAVAQKVGWKASKKSVKSRVKILGQVLAEETIVGDQKTVEVVSALLTRAQALAEKTVATINAKMQVQATATQTPTTQEESQSKPPKKVNGQRAALLAEGRDFFTFALNRVEFDLWAASLPPEQTPSQALDAYIHEKAGGQ